MNSISLSVASVQKHEQTVLTVTVLDSEWPGSNQTKLFAEVGESLVRGSYQHFSFDLSRLRLVSSVVFGACANIVSIAGKNKKNIELVLNREAAETARIASLDKMVRIVEV
jgi:hypothetical protein